MESRYKLTMCRLCLCENECFFNIFALNDWQGYVAAEIITDLLQFQVSETDAYPHVVCSTCLTKLNEFRLFKEYCQKSKVTYDDMFVSNDRLEEHKPEMVTFKSEELIIDSCSHEVSEDPLIETEVTIKSEEVTIDSSPCEVSKDPLMETEVSCGPILLKYEVLPFNRDSRSQEELIDSEVSENQGKCESTAALMQVSPQDNMKPLNLEPEEGVIYSTEEEEGGRGTVPEKIIGGRKCKFECHCCRKVLSTKRNLRQHLASHGIGNFFKCDVCGKISVSKWKLKIHIRQHTGERPYKCTDCSVLFRYKSSLIVHMQVHAKTKPFKCKECNLSFSRSNNLKSHMKLHSDFKPYSCKVCHVTFRDKSNLTKHMRIHSGDRPYKCTVCSKAFSRSTHLRKHQVVHSGEKPHPCPHCSKRFSDRGNLKRHLMTVCVEKS